MGVRRLNNGHVQVTEDKLHDAVRSMVGQAPGDWVRDLTTGGGYMRRQDGAIATLSARQVAALDAAQLKGAPTSRRMREEVLRRVSGT